ncbi:GFA family protein [Parvularcula sp. LCG005]|uniref:GFA family protein n=1 Tax=Parvularcula sp. LCG005 TaxID=3078805 RepID=UPI002943ACE1|nr:GFA family protein [Parvularcula sp. LCG005]WOI52140.1 GFA family protein [Parvularcula sp. LCG005]
MSARQGGCHCGAVRWEADLPAAIEAQRCNCSICTAVGFIHVIVPKARFRLLAGADALTRYQFNTRTATHLFCSVCGVKSHYIPRSHPDGYSLNLNCLDTTGLDVTITAFDGQNWEDNVSSLPSTGD